MNDLFLAAAVMAFGLVLMLASVAHPTPLTIALFLGLGLSSGALGVLLFARAVLRDLRKRRAL